MVQRRLFLLFLAITAGCLHSVRAVSQAEQAASSTMVGQIICDSADTVITPGKVEAALLLAYRLADRSVVGVYERDSILADYDSTEAYTAIEGAKILNCTDIVFVSTKRLGHLVRSDVQVLSANDSHQPRTGVGYASITYARSEAELIADPAVLTSIQRALLTILTPTPRYDTLSSGLRAVAANLIAVSGVAFVDSAANASAPQLFKEHTVVSYDVALTIVKALQEVDSLVAIDLDTRDEMFAMAGFHMVDNDRSPSAVEMRILRGFDIGRMVTGRIVRGTNGIALTLVNASLQMDGSFVQESVVTIPVDTDTKTALRDAVVEATHRLYGSTTAPDK